MTIPQTAHRPGSGRAASDRRIDVQHNFTNCPPTLAVVVSLQLGFWDLIAVLPHPVVAQAVASGDLIVKTSPIDIPPARISMAWHRCHNQDAGLNWLRGAMDEIVQSKQALFDVLEYWYAWKDDSPAYLHPR